MPQLHVLDGGTWKTLTKPIRVREDEEWKVSGSEHVLQGGSWDRLRTTPPDTPSFDAIASNSPDSYSNINVTWTPASTGGAVAGYELTKKNYDSQGGLLSTETPIVVDKDTTTYNFPVTKDSKYSFDVKALGVNNSESNTTTYKLQVGHPAVQKIGYNEGWIVNNNWRWMSEHWSAVAHTGANASAALNSSQSGWVDPTYKVITAQTAAAQNNSTYGAYYGGNGSYYPWIRLDPLSGNRLRLRKIKFYWRAYRGEANYNWPVMSLRSFGTGIYEVRNNGLTSLIAGPSYSVTNDFLNTSWAYDEANIQFNLNTWIDTSAASPNNRAIIRCLVYSCAEIVSDNETDITTHANFGRTLGEYDVWGNVSSYTYYDPPEENNSTW